MNKKIYYIQSSVLIVLSSLTVPTLEKKIPHTYKAFPKLNANSKFEKENAISGPTGGKNVSINTLSGQDTILSTNF